MSAAFDWDAWDTEYNRVFYLIVWTVDGDERRLAVVCAQWFDKPDYRLASETEYDDENQAYGDAIALGVKHDVKVDLSRWFPILTE